MDASMARVAINFQMGLLMRATLSKIASKVKAYSSFQLENIRDHSFRDAWKVEEYLNGKMDRSMKENIATIASMEGESTSLYRENLMKEIGRTASGKAVEIWQMS